MEPTNGHSVILPVNPVDVQGAAIEQMVTSAAVDVEGAQMALETSTEAVKAMGEASAPPAPEKAIETHEELVNRLAQEAVVGIGPAMASQIGAQWEVGRVVFSLLNPYTKTLDKSDRDYIYGLMEKEYGKKQSHVRDCEKVYRVFYKVASKIVDGEGEDVSISPEIAKPEYGRNWNSLLYLASEFERLQKSSQDILLDVYTWSSAVIESHWTTDQLKDILGGAIKQGLPVNDISGAYTHYMEVEQSLRDAKIAKREKQEETRKETLAALKAIREGKTLPIDNAPVPEVNTVPDIVNTETLSSVLTQVLVALQIDKADIHAALSGAPSEAIETCKKIGASLDLSKVQITDLLSQVRMERDSRRETEGRVKVLRDALDYLSFKVRGLDISTLSEADALEAVWRFQGLTPASDTPAPSLPTVGAIAVLSGFKVDASGVRWDRKSKAKKAAAETVKV